MSKADEMFEKLGYQQTYCRKSITEYVKKFDLKKDRIIAFYTDHTVSVFEETANKDCFTMQELQAINQKVKELGWNE